MAHEYGRWGALNLFAAFATRTGHVYARTAERKRQVEFIACLEQVDREIACYITTIHLVLAHLRMHKGKQGQAWLAKHPRFVLHYPPVHGSWMSQVEQWFSIVQRKRLQIADCTNKAHLSERLMTFVPQWNEHAHPSVGCATVSYDDRLGERLMTRRMARLPETNKATLKRQLTAEVTGALSQRPDLHGGKVADGTADNWTSLGETLPLGEEVVDFYHAVEQLSNALGAAYGEGKPKHHERLATLRAVLRDAPQGVDRVREALCRLRNRYPRRQALHQAIAYFREHRQRMRSSHLRAQLLPIGSGVVEAACQTLVSQRLKRSGMRWRAPGGQAILTFRALCQSERFERAWP